MRPPEFWSGDNWRARTIARALTPIGFLYAASVAWKHRHLKPYRARAKVICIGNLTVGGSGKTPIAIAVAQLIRAKGIPVAFLTRGYGRLSAEAVKVDPQTHNVPVVGDEAFLLAQNAPTIVARDRAQGARLAERYGAEVIVMDDGYQNFTLAKDLSLVVVDAEYGFGNGRIIPAGPLREPVDKGLERADAVILSGNGYPPLPKFDRPVLRARLMSDKRLDGERVVAFAGIGRPEKFFGSLQDSGATLVEKHGFADHHVYRRAEIAMLRERARSSGAKLMTTEKDFVRLDMVDRPHIDVLPVNARFDDPNALEQLLKPILQGLKTAS